MQGHAKVWSICAALGVSGCAAHAVLDEPQRKPAPPGANSADDAPYGVTKPISGSAGFGGQSGKGGAASSSGGGASHAGSAGGAGTGGAGTGGAGTGGAGTGGNNAGLAGGGSSAGSAASGAAGASPDPTKDCPSLTRARLANGACVDRVTEFSVATNPSSIATGSDGRIWFDDGSGNQIVQLDDQGRILNRIAFDDAASQRELVGGSGDVAIWYSDSRAKTLTSVSKALQRTSFDLAFAATALSLGEGNEFWLSEAGRAVYRVKPSEASITRWPAAPANTIIVGPDKNLWFPEGVRISRLIPPADKQDFPITDSFADDLCAGPDEALWFTDGSLSQIGRMAADGTLSRTYDLPLNSKPYRIIAGPDGALWFTEEAAEKIGRISVKGVITHYPIPTSNSLPHAITVGPDHNLWFTELFSGKIGRLIPDPVQ